MNCISDFVKTDLDRSTAKAVRDILVSKDERVKKYVDKLKKGDLLFSRYRLNEKVSEIFKSKGYDEEESVYLADNFIVATVLDKKHYPSIKEVRETINKINENLPKESVSIRDKISYDIAYKTIDTIATKIKEKTGIKYKIRTEMSKDEKRKYGNLNGWFDERNKMVNINMSKDSKNTKQLLNTVWHEYSHPLVEALKRYYTSAYIILYNDFEKVINKVKKNKDFEKLFTDDKSKKIIKIYSYVSRNYPELDPIEQTDEMIVRYISELISEGKGFDNGEAEKKAQEMLENLKLGRVSKYTLEDMANVLFNANDLREIFDKYKDDYYFSFEVKKNIDGIDNSVKIDIPYDQLYEEDINMKEKNIENTIHDFIKIRTASPKDIKEHNEKLSELMDLKNIKGGYGVRKIISMFANIGIENENNENEYSKEVDALHKLVNKVINLYINRDETDYEKLNNFLGLFGQKLEVLSIGGVSILNGNEKMILENLKGPIHKYINDNTRYVDGKEDISLFEKVSKNKDFETMLIDIYNDIEAYNKQSIKNGNFIDELLTGKIDSATNKVIEKGFFEQWQEHKKEKNIIYKKGNKIKFEKIKDELNIFIRDFFKDKNKDIFEEEIGKGYYEFIRDLQNFVLSVERKYFGLNPEFNTQVVLNNENYVKQKDGKEKNYSVSGRADLIVFMDNNQALVYDIKVKSIRGDEEDTEFDLEKKTLNAWTKFRGYFKHKELNTVTNTASHTTSLQTSSYALMLEKLGFDVVDTGALLFGVEVHNDKEFEKENTVDNISKKKYFNKKILMVNDKNKTYKALNNFTNELLETEFFSNLRNKLKYRMKEGELREEYDIRNISDIVEDLTGMPIIDNNYNPSNINYIMDYRLHRDVNGNVIGFDDILGLNKYLGDSKKFEFKEKGLSKDLSEKSLLKNNSIPLRDEFYVAFTEEEKNNSELQRKKINEYLYSSKVKSNIIVDNLIDFFNGEGTKSSYASNTNIYDIIKKFNNLEWEMVKLNSIYGMRDMDLPIILLKNKFNDSIIPIYLSMQKADMALMKLEDKKIDKKTNMFIKYVNNTYIKTKDAFASKENYLLATTTNFKKLILGNVIARLKYNNEDITIDNAYIFEGINTKNETITRESTMNLLSIAEEAFNVYKKTNQDKRFKGVMVDMMEKKELFNYRKYIPDPVESFVNFFNEINSIYFGDNKNMKNIEESIREKISLFQDRMINSVELLEQMDAIYKNFENVSYKLYKNKKFNEDDLNYIKFLFHKLLVSIRGISAFTLNLTEKSWVKWIDENLSNEREVPIYFRQQIDKLIRMNDEYITRDYYSFHDKLRDIIKKLMAEKGYSKASTSVSPSLLDLFGNMFRNTNNIKDVKTLYTLKHEDELRGVEREFVLFWKEYMRKSFINEVGEERFAKMKKDDENIEYYMPIIRKSRQSSNRFSINKVDEFTDEWKLSAQEPVKGSGYKASASDTSTEFILGSFLFSNYKNKRSLLGISDQADKIKDEKKFEDVELNLEYVLTKTYVKSLEKHYHSDTISVTNHLISMLKAMPDIFGDEDTIRNTIEAIRANIQEKVIGNIGRDQTLAKLSRMVTNTVLISAKQVLMDSATMFISGNVYLMSNFFYKHVYSGKTNIPGYFGFNEWKKAGNMIVFGTAEEKKLLDKIMEEYAFLYSDAKVFGSTRYIESMSSGLQALGFKGQEAVGNRMRKQAIIASMLHDGSFYGHYLDENEELRYDETKDRRFYDEDGNFINKPLLDAIKKKMWDESRDGIERIKDENGNYTGELGKLRRAYVSVDINNIVGILSKMIGFFGKEGRVIAFRNDLMQQLMKFKSWILAKKSLYWTEKDVHSQTYQGWKRIVDEEGNISYELYDMTNEGIIQSLISIARKAKEYQWKEFKGVITDKERQNVAILTTHLLIAATIGGLLELLNSSCERDKNGNRKPGCWYTTTQAGKDTKSALKNVLGDQLIPYATVTMFLDNRSSAFATASILYNTTINTIYALFGWIFDNQYDAAHAFDKVMRISGLWRTGKDIYEPLAKPDGLLDDWLNEK